MTDPCPNCARSLSLDHRICGVCGADGKPPNVRVASRPDEAAALRVLEDQAVQEASRRGATHALDHLGQRVETSKMVINRPLRVLEQWINRDDELYVNFYQLKREGAKPADDAYNRQRLSAENTISPGFFDQLTIGALTTDGKGMSYYGGWNIVIRDADIRLRASVFWENPFEFNKRMNIISGEDPPVGYRAPWPDRSRLARAKLGDRVEPGDDDEALNRRLMGPDKTARDCGFIEVHVYEPIHADSIEAVTPPDTIPTQLERTEWLHLQQKLVARGINC